MDPHVRKANKHATDNGRFQFMEKLDEGGFGTVLLAHDKQNSGRKVAIKCVNTGRAEKGLIKIFKIVLGVRKLKTEASKEADMLLKLQHPGILGFLKAYEYQEAHNTVLAIVTDFCENGDLSKYLKIQGKSPDPYKRLQWFQQLANGLKYIHSQGIVHRDIKPQNVLVSDEETLKIADVGLAKALYDIQNPSASDDSFPEYMTSLVGTESFVAPEVWEQHYGQSSDIFSLGLVFVAIVEVPPSLIPVAKWNGKKEPLGLMYHSRSATQHLKPSHLLQLTKETPAERILLDRMLVYDYHVRYSTEDVLEELKVMMDLVSKFLYRQGACEPQPQPQIQLRPPEASCNCNRGQPASGGCC